MIAYFPEIYEDELAYSLFARYHVHTGHLTYTATAEDLFASSNVIPSTEFIVPLSDKAINILTKEMSFEHFIEKHTMIPYYIRFLSLERRRKAFGLLKAMDKSFYDALYMRRCKTENRKYLRYCPLCAAADRGKYGETYWHRRHQLDGIDICTVHYCRLLPTTVGIDFESQHFYFTPAEEKIPYESLISLEISAQERQIADYVVQVFDAPIDLQTNTAVGKFLHTKLEGTRYTSPRGENVYARKIYADMTAYYGELPQYSFKAWWYVQKVFCSQNFHTYDICLIAIFLKLSVSELLEMRMPKISLHHTFDAKVLELHSQGMTYKQIAEMLKVPLNTIKAIGEKRYLSTQMLSDGI